MNDEKTLDSGMGFSGLSGYAWRSLKGHWFISIGCMFIVVLLQFGAGYIPVAGKISQLLLSPLSAGLLLFYIHLIRGEELNAGLLFKPFEQYFRFVWASIRIFIFVFLWSLLLVIPGIIASLRYSMTIYIMLDDPEITVKDAMKQSSKIMYGNKWRLFGYGWLLFLITVPALILTLGLGAFVLGPWLGAWGAAFYESVRSQPEMVHDDEVISGSVI